MAGVKLSIWSLSSKYQFTWENTLSLIDNDEGDDLENNNQRMTILKTNEQDLRWFISCNVNFKIISTFTE